MAVPPTRLPVAQRIFRALLRALPVDFRVEHGREMEQVFRTQRQEAQIEGTISAIIGLWYETLRDLLTTAPHQHVATLRQDVGYALRTLRHTPVFTAAALLTLAIGITASAAIFTIINAFLFRPLPVERPDQLVSIATLDGHIEMPHGLSFPDLQDYATLNDVFAGVLGYHATGVWLNAGSGAERVVLEAMTENAFELLGVRPRIGRVLAPSDERTPVVVLTHEFWQARFAGDPAIVGRTVRLNEETFTIVGVSAPSFTGLESLLRISAFIPLSMLDRLRGEGNGQPGSLAVRDQHQLFTIGRLRPDVSLAQARQALALRAQALAKEYPDTNRGVTLFVVPETQARPVPQNGPMFRVAAGVLSLLAGLLLLITSANVANMLLARAAARGREMALRAALGARRGRIVRQLLTESLVLAGLGGLTAVLLAVFVAAAMERGIAALSFEVPLRVDFGIDWRVLLAIVAVATGAGAIAGLAPALSARRADVNVLLKTGGRAGDGPSAGRLRGMLVIAQIAVSLVLLVIGGLFVKTLERARDFDLGFRTDHLLLASVDLSKSTYTTAARAAYYRDAGERIATLPGVRAVAWISALPFGYSQGLTELQPLEATGESARLSFNVAVTPEYFAVAGVRLQSGRVFDARDSADAPPVIVINETLGSLLWPQQSPLGRRIRIGPKGPLAEVVGIVRTGKYVLLWEAPRPMFFQPLPQVPSKSATLEVVTIGAPVDLAGAVRTALAAMDPDVPVHDIQSMADYLENGSAFLLFRIGALVTGVFGALGLVLASIGLYGVVAYDTTRKTHDIGVRMALGALRTDILREVLTRSAWLAVSGTIAGGVAAAGVAWMLRTLLLGVSPFDASIYGTTAVLLFGVCMLASFIPARRATTQSPIEALRVN